MTPPAALALASFLTLLWPRPSPAVELSIEYPALQRILAQQMFTQDGRKYVRGSQTARCSFAYLENPRIGVQDGHLRIEARFTGRSARDFFGRCIGLGDAFEMLITTAPYYHDGMIGFREVRVDSTGRDGFYIRRVRAAMTQTLSKDFQYPLFDDARKTLEEMRPNAPYSQQLQDFRVARIRVTPRALVLTLDFALIVR